MNFLIEHTGLIAGIISFSAYFIYIVHIFQGKTKPSRSTWWILALIGTLVFTSSYSLEAKEGMWIQLANILGPLIIGFLSLFKKYGYGSKLLAIDKICLVGAVLCLTFWVVFNSPLIAFIGSILVDFLALIPTIKKAYIDPKEEDALAWNIEVVAAIINTLGISVWFSTVGKDWIYALYFLIINSTIALLLLRPYFRKKLDNLKE